MGASEAPGGLKLVSEQIALQVSFILTFQLDVKTTHKLINWSINGTFTYNLFFKNAKYFLVLSEGFSVFSEFDK